MITHTKHEFRLPTYAEERDSFSNPALYDGLLAYFNDHDLTRVGGFLTAVLENDLLRAVNNCANPDDLVRISYILNRCPSGSFGSPEKVRIWVSPPKPKNIYQVALDIQDASNASGVIHEFSRVVDAIWKEPECTGSDYIAKHPVTIVFLDKLCSLAGASMMDFAVFEDAYVRCRQRAAEIA